MVRESVNEPEERAHVASHREHEAREDAELHARAERLEPEQYARFKDELARRVQAGDDETTAVRRALEAVEGRR